MRELLRGYGKGLVAVFFGAVAIWALVLIVLPQLAMLERALTKPKRQLDSSIAAQLERDAFTCINVLQQHQAPSETVGANGGMAVPSASGMAVPSASGMSVPSASGMAVPSASDMDASASEAATRPYILQCDRATTRKKMVRDAGEKAWLNELYDLPLLEVTDSPPIEDQIATAEEITRVAGALYQDLLVMEANASRFGFGNFAALTQPVLIPLAPETKAEEDAALSNVLLGVLGLRFERDGQVYERIGMVTLTRTLIFAILATTLALVVCYPIAYKVALATPPERAMWLFLGLVIPYAIVELMRIYAWTAIIDNEGLLNQALMWAGAISEPIQFKRSALTVFVVIVYTYVLFMVFPIFNVMSTLDRNQIEAARDLGASTARLHWRVIMPHAKPGIAVGCIATFMLAAGAFSVPRIISRGLQAEWFSQTIYNKFFESENSNVGAAYSFAYTLVCFLLVALFMWTMRTRLKDFARVQ
ncbi:Putrescine transport system permease protein PotH [Roseovarius sp. THAF27]|uniref:ABC transporter permease n=1 Tax=Roseovarius sp. THAF27 TaxID=2587850 RepID=UPI0012684962|nr:ABC transporter permease [Roseovarius sp. THAF27]QFT82322.1 Putrescine transport system permease protein PotH [Roseovarius sp. THAF27]